MMEFRGESSKDQVEEKGQDQWVYVILAIILSLILISLSNVAHAQTRDEDKKILFKEIVAPLTLEKMQICAACVWKHTRHLNPKTEAAAWIIKDGADYSCLYWPVNTLTVNQTPDAVASLTWKGMIPPNAAGIIHSHPNGADRMPSSGDVDLVERLAIPNYVVSQYGVSGALWWLKLEDDGEVKAKVSSISVYDSKALSKISKLLNSENCPDKMPDHMLWKINPIVDGK